MPSKKELYKQVKDLLSKDEFQKRIDEKMKDWHKLIDENAAAFLVVDELDRNRIEFSRISDVKDGLVNISAKVDSVGELKELVTKRGPGRLVNIALSDETGRCRLALWGNDIGLIDRLGIEEGKRIRIINGMAKITRFGIDVTKGRWGIIELI